MVIKSIRMRIEGEEREEYHVLGERVNVIGTRWGEELAAAIAAVTNGGEGALPSRREGQRISAEAKVEAGGREYTVRTEMSGEGLRLTASQPSGEDATAEYGYLTAHSKEENRCDLFNGDDAEDAPRLLKYTAEDRFFACGELENLTRGATKLAFFRKVLRSFIRALAPEVIREGKRYELVTLADGEFAVRVRDGDYPVLLSEAEDRIFRYLCFLRTAEFWQEFEGMRNIHAVRKPLVIRGLLERLDEEISLTDIVKRTFALERQAIFITLPNDTKHIEEIKELSADF